MVYTLLGVLWLAEDDFLLVGLFYSTEAHFMPLSFQATAYYHLCLEAQRITLLAVGQD